MTGYGRGTKSVPEYTITIDLKSVNHRYLEIYFKIPKTYSFLEDKLRRDITQKISRGKLEVVVTVERFSPDTTLVELNKPLAMSYIKALNELKDEFKVSGEINLQSLTAWNDIFKSTQPAEDQDYIAEVASGALIEALVALMSMRRQEGEGLTRDLLSKVDLLDEMRLTIQTLVPTVVSSYQEKLTKRIQELTGGIEIDPNRLAAEIALFADKADISEELVRLGSHHQQFISLISSDQPVGRKLDFLIQEMNREINTIGSKGNDLKIAQIVIDFKAELERIREQIQNIE